MQRSCKFKSRLQKAGFTLLEILLVIAVVGILATLAVSQVKKQAENKRINRVATQFQYVMEAAVAYESADADRKWPPAAAPANDSFIKNYLPNGNRKSALGEDFSWYGADGNSKKHPLFTVYLKVPGADPMKTAQQIAAQLPNATTMQNVPTTGGQDNDCTINSACYVKAQVPMPATIGRGDVFINGLCSTVVGDKREVIGDNGSMASCDPNDLEVVADPDGLGLLRGDTRVYINGNCPANYRVSHQLKHDEQDFSVSINGFATLSETVKKVLQSPVTDFFSSDEEQYGGRTFLIPMELDTPGKSLCWTGAGGSNSFQCVFYLRGAVLSVNVTGNPSSTDDSKPEDKEIKLESLRVKSCNQGVVGSVNHDSCNVELSYSIRCVPD